MVLKATAETSAETAEATASPTAAPETISTAEAGLTGVGAYFPTPFFLSCSL